MDISGGTTATFLTDGRSESRSRTISTRLRPVAASIATVSCTSEAEEEESLLWELGLSLPAARWVPLLLVLVLPVAVGGAAAGAR